jgi:hypothetical protein
MNFVGEQYDNRFLSYVGWEKDNVNRASYLYFFSKENMASLSREITRRLMTTGKEFRVTDRVIGGVMSDIARSNNPVIGDIQTRLVVPAEKPRDDIENMNSQVVTVIVNTILDEYETTVYNGRLSVWSTVYGDFNKEGLRAHSVIRKKENDYIKGVFSMNY